MNVLPSRRRLRPATRILTITLTAVFLVLALAGCGSDDGPAAPGGGSGGGGNNGAGTMSATIDGVAWTAVVTTAVNQSGLVAIGGANTGAIEGIGLGFFAAAPGTYVIGPGTANTANISNTSSNVWSASGSQGSGTIVVTALTATSVVGTFSFTAPTTTGATPATRVVTNGAFNLTFGTTAP